jgi:hypothetical protein
MKKGNGGTRGNTRQIEEAAHGMDDLKKVLGSYRVTAIRYNY